jgi:hypothetical protein
VLATAIALVGCSKPQQPWEKVYPAGGVVKYRGQPLSGAVVTLIPEEADFPSSVRPTAVTDDDGAFEVGTYSADDGAPAGKYKVLVLHYPVVGSAENPYAGPNDLPPMYAKAETTTLKITIPEEALVFCTIPKKFGEERDDTADEKTIIAAPATAWRIHAD